MKSRGLPRLPPVFFLLMLLSADLPLLSQSAPPKTASPTTADSPIRFAFQPIDFKLDSNESPERHAPETMAGGVAVFDYNNDGKLDIFFTNGANLKTLQKDSPKYNNHLFENDGHGHFTDVTEKAG
ncbi:MAG TPA: VCBS repeat-containing protein, partial [Candidatus Sulfotelmatobacter sp.]|nr:VCBS repeat-containing protein [Candidatus Sulfotelmatobacter sp.]